MLDAADSGSGVGERKAEALMKPQVYTKSIAELAAGDVISIRGDELQPPQPATRYQATVVMTTTVSALRCKAVLRLDGQTDVVSTTELPLLHKIELASLEGQEMVWVDLPNLEVGDCIRWRGYFVPVEHVERQADRYLVTVTDPRGGAPQTFAARPDAALRVKITEANPDQKAAGPQTPGSSSP
jgi:hypothetical protein